jgi:hypothetical protein
MGKKNRKFFFCFLCIKNGFKGVLNVFWRLLFLEVGKSDADLQVTTSSLTKIPHQARPAGPPPGRQSRTPAGEAYGEAYTGASRL